MTTSHRPGPRHPQRVRPADLYPARDIAAGRSPDTQPISRADYARLQARASQPRLATGADRAARAVAGVASSVPLGLVGIALGACTMGAHGAGIATSVALAWAAVRACVGAADGRPL